MVTTAMRIAIERTRAAHKLVGILNVKSIAELTGKDRVVLAASSEDDIDSIVSNLTSYGARWSKSTARPCTGLSSAALFPMCRNSQTTLWILPAPRSYSILRVPLRI